MNNDDLERALAATDLSALGITLEEAVRRAADRTPSRGPSGTLRLATAAIITWVAVIALQAAVERNISASLPADPMLVEAEAVPSGVAQQRRLLSELMGDALWASETAHSAPAEPDPPTSGSTEHRRSGSVTQEEGKSCLA